MKIPILRVSPLLQNQQKRSTASVRVASTSTKVETSIISETDTETEAKVTSTNDDESEDSSGTNHQINLQLANDSIILKSSPSTSAATTANINSSSSFDCRFCKRSFRVNSNRAAHERIHTGEKPFVCKRCNKSFSWRRTWSRHCMKCKENNLKSTVKVTRAKSSTVWTQTLSILAADSYIDSKIVEGKTIYFCKVCDRSSPRLSAMRMHCLLHTGIKNYSCSFCNRRFSAKHSMKTHERRHTGEHPFSCPRCGKGYGSSTALKYHTTGNKCSDSDEASTLAVLSQIHRDNNFKIRVRHPNMIRTVENGTVVNICAFCGKKYVSLDSIKVHLRTHTGETPYTCSVCQRKFTRRSSCNYHEKRHADFGSVNTRQRPQQQHHHYQQSLPNNVSTPSKSTIIGSNVNTLVSGETLRSLSAEQLAQQSIKNARASDPYVTRKIVNGVVVNFCNFCLKQFKAFRNAKLHTKIHIG